MPAQNNHLCPVIQAYCDLKSFVVNVVVFAGSAVKKQPPQSVMLLRLGCSVADMTVSAG